MTARHGMAHRARLELLFLKMSSSKDSSHPLCFASLSLTPEDKICQQRQPEEDA